MEHGTGENVTLMVVPLFQSIGMVCLMRTNICAGATMVIMPRRDRDPSGAADLARQGEALDPYLTLVIDPMASPNFRQYDLSRMVCIGGGGAAMPQAVALLSK